MTIETHVVPSSSNAGSQTSAWLTVDQSGADAADSDPAAPVCWCWGRREMVWCASDQRRRMALSKLSGVEPGWSGLPGGQPASVCRHTIWRNRFACSKRDWQRVASAAALGKRLVSESRPQALALFKSGGGKALESRLRLETQLNRALPMPVRRRNGCADSNGAGRRWGIFTLDRSGVQLTTAQAAHLLELGLSRLANGDFRGTRDRRTPLVIRYWKDIVPGPRIPRWDKLLTRARASHEHAGAAQRGESCRWDSGMTSSELAAIASRHYPTATRSGTKA